MSVYYTNKAELTSVAHAIRTKGQTEELLEYPEEFVSAIAAIPGPEIATKDVNFYDYDGTVVDSYTAEEFLQIAEMPPNPSHEGLIAQGWNWDLETAQTYVSKYGSCEIGQMYITSDGKTHAIVELDESELLTAIMKFQQSANDAVTIDWGDGSEEETAQGTTAVSVSHVYAEPGTYEITLDVAENKTMQIGNNATFQGGFVGMASGWSGRTILKKLYIGQRVTGISGYGLWHQTNLTEITIPNGLTAIGTRGLEALLHLRAIVIPTGVTSMEDYAFRCDYNLEVLSLPKTITTIKSPFMTCVNLRRVSIPEGVAALGASAFQRCFSADVISVPDSVKSFGNSCFENCYALKKLNIPVGTTILPNSMCRQCHSLRKADIPEGVTTIRQLAFSGIFGIPDMVIPSTVTSIEGFAFLYLDGPNTFHVKATTPPTLEATAFTETKSDIIIYVPYSADHSVLNAYLAATGWSSRGDKIQEEAET